jgi:hypothetical protein
MAKIKKTLSTIGIWLGLQIAVTVPFAIVAAVRKQDMMDVLAPALLIADAAVILVLWAIRYFKIKELFKGVPAEVLLLSLVLGFAALYAVDILTIPFNIPNYMEDAFDAMSKSILGFLGICIVGPVMEEIMMRRIILTEIREATGKKWLGIIISAAIFAIVHGNPIQVVFAMPAGILLGWLYCRTGSLLVPICVHIMNNTFSFITMRVGAGEPMEFSDTWTQIQLWSCIAVTVLLIIWMVSYYRKKEKLEAEEALAQAAAVNEEPMEVPVETVEETRTEE